MFEAIGCAFSSAETSPTEDIFGILCKVSSLGSLTWECALSDATLASVSVKFNPDLTRNLPFFLTLFVPTTALSDEGGICGGKPIPLLTVSSTSDLFASATDSFVGESLPVSETDVVLTRNLPFFLVVTAGATISLGLSLVDETTD